MACAYTLAGLPSPGACPECGRAFDLAKPSSFTLKVPFARATYWAPSLLLAAIGGAMCTALVVFGMGNWSAALWIGVPFSMGCIIGYGTRARTFVTVMLIIAAAVAFIMTLMSMQLAGIFCGLVLAAIVTGPILLGTFAGWLLRQSMRLSRFTQRVHLPPVLFLAIGPIWALVEGHAGPQRLESVSTREVISAPVRACWDGIMYYEQVRHEAPLILRIGLAHPLYTIGSSSAVGDRKTCVYDKGRITKQVTRADRDRILAFDVIEQSIGYEHDVHLTGGSFTFEPLDDTHTAVTLTTRYEPLITPRFVWRWAEGLAIHTLHGHVLEGMRRRATGVDRDAPEHTEFRPDAPDRR